MRNRQSFEKEMDIIVSLFFFFSSNSFEFSVNDLGLNETHHQRLCINKNVFISKFVTATQSVNRQRESFE